MKIDVYNQNNERVDEIDLPDRIFAVKWNVDLVHQAFLTQIANSRQLLAHTKGRGEVSGGGKKPWRQKGTGRARHGSIRSPLWIGGGATFGPTKERVFAKKINKKMNRLAIFSILSKKLADNELKIMENFPRDSALMKTSVMAKFLKELFGGKKANALLIAAPENKSINRAVSNIENIDAIGARSLNVKDLLKYKNIILEKKAVEEIEKTYGII